MVKRVTVLTILFLAAFCAMGQQKPAPAAQAPSADEKAIRAESAAWLRSKTPEQFSSYYAQDATLMPPGSAAITGTEKIRAYWVEFFKQPGLTFSGNTTKVELARSGEMAVEQGAVRLTVNDASGKPAASDFKYVVVWKKQAGGKWKAYTDIFNSNK